MFEPPVDTFPVWVGLALASVCFLGVAAQAPAAPTPDATSVADSIDAVAAGAPPTRAAHPITATAVKLGTRRIGLRADGGTAHATLAYGPVTPVGRGSRLDRILRGAPPSRVFETGAAFRRAVDRARTAERTWRPAGNRVHVRHVDWEGVDVTLVGA